MNLHCLKRSNRSGLMAICSPKSILILAICAIFVFIIMNEVQAPFYVENPKYIVTFKMDSDLLKQTIYITIENKQDSSDSLDMTTLINSTNFPADLIRNSRFYVQQKQEYEVYIYGTECNPYNTISPNGTVIEHPNCVRTVRTETRERLIWKEKSLMYKQSNNQEYKESWENVGIQKAGQDKSILKFKLEFRTPILRSEAGWGSSGKIYLNLNGEMFYDFEHSSWWDSNWIYKKALNITNMNETYDIEQNYTINMTIDTSALYLAGKMLDNGTDLRVVCNNKSIDWINTSGFNTTATDTLFMWHGGNISAGSDNNTFCEIYYGNPSASAPPNEPRNVYYIYADGDGYATDFDSAGSPALEGGAIVLTGSGTAGENYILSKYNISAGFKAYARMSASHDSQTWLFGWASNFIYTGNRFSIIVKSTDKIALRNENGSESIIGTFTKDTFYEYEILIHRSGVYEIYQDGALQHKSYYLTMTQAKLHSEIRFNAKLINITEMSGRLYIYPEPSVSFGAEEEEPTVDELVITITSPINTTYNTASINLDVSINEIIDWAGYELNGATNVTSIYNTETEGIDPGCGGVLISSLQWYAIPINFSESGTLYNFSLYLENLSISNTKPLSVQIVNDSIDNLPNGTVIEEFNQSIPFASNCPHNWINFDNTDLNFVAGERYWIKIYTLQAGNNYGITYSDSDYPNKTWLGDFRTSTLNQGITWTTVYYNPGNPYAAIRLNTSLTGFLNTTITAQEGSNIIYVWANDTSGNMNYSRVVFTVDTIPPDSVGFLLPTPANDTSLNQNNYFINVSFNDTYPDWCELELTNSSGTINYTMTQGVNSSEYYFNVSNQSDYSTYFYIYCNDTADNWGRSLARHVIIDTTNPMPVIHIPINNSIVIGKNIQFNYSINELNEDKCWYSIDDGANTTISSCINITILSIDYGEHNITLYVNDTAGNWNKTTNFFNNSFAIWNISLFNENDWDVPFDMDLPDSVMLFLFCFGLDTSTFNLSNSTTTITANCRVESILIRVEYPTDSYTRERLAPSGTNINLSMYLVDAFNETLLQTPFIMGDSPFFGSNLTIYKISEDGQTRIISQGTFDVEYKHVSYLIKDNKYNLRITNNGAVREIGFFQAVSAGTQTININQIQLGPDITLINNNIIMSAETDDTTQTLIIEYLDKLNQTNSVQIFVYNGTTVIPFYNMTFNNIDDLTVTLAVNTSHRFTVKWIVNHELLGNSPIYFTTGAGAFGALFYLGVAAWIYQAIGFIFVLFSSFVITPKNRLVGIAFISVILSFMAFAAWLTLGTGVALILLVFVGLAVVYEIRRLGLT